MLNLRTVAGAAAIACAALAYANHGPKRIDNIPFQLPPQAVVSVADIFGLIGALTVSVQFIDPRSFAVMGPNATFRQNAFDNTTLFNPTASTPPFFQVFDEAFLQILGPNATIRQVAVNDTFAFAHEAPIYNEATDELFFASNDGGALGMSDLNHNSVYGKISLKDVAAAFATNDSEINVPVTEVSPSRLQRTTIFGNLFF
jgi:hypothetical protein